MAEPPFEVGAVQVRSTWPLPGVPLTLVGALGSERGVTAEEAAESAPEPAALVALTLKEALAGALLRAGGVEGAVGNEGGRERGWRCGA